MLLLSIIQSRGRERARQTAPNMVYRGLTGAPGQPHARGRALAQHVSAEAELLGRSAASLSRQSSGAFDQALALDQAPEILLVQAGAGNGLDGPLKLQKRVLKNALPPTVFSHQEVLAGTMRYGQEIR